MKKVAVVCDSFAPFNTISSIRPTKMAKYIKKNEKCEITVMCRYIPEENKDALLEKDLIYIDKFIRIDYFVFDSFLGLSKLIKKKKAPNNTKNVTQANNVSIAPSGKGIKSKLKAYIATIIENIKMLVFIIKNYRYFSLMKKEIKRYGANEFDVIFSTYGPMSSHLIGRYLKKKNPNAVWIADFRDTVYSNMAPQLFAPIFHRYKKKIVNQADKITAISQGVLDSLEAPEHKSTRVITNGFDTEDIMGISVKPHKDGKLHFTYAGLIYAEKRDLTLLFRALKELAQEGLIALNNIAVDYAGSTYNEIYNQAKSVGAQEVLVNHGFLKRGESLELQLKSDILLLASWNRQGHTGILTGKLFEYMMMGKPIISIINGSLPNSEIKEFTNRCSLGFCCEYANFETDFTALKEYVLEIYNKFMNTSAVSDPRNMVEVEGYNYKNLAKQLIDFM